MMNDRISICIVEDSAEVAAGLASILSESADCRLVATFTTAEEALEGLPVHSPDVVIMDVNLPGMNGIECMRKVSVLMPRSQFMMFTIYENDESVFEALEAGASGYLLKNTPSEKILEAIAELHAGGAPMTAHIARRVVSSFQRTDKEEKLSMLTTREQEVLTQLARGLLYKEIASKLSISTGTVRQHIHKIYEKLHVQNRTEALNKAFGSRQP